VAERYPADSVLTSSLRRCTWDYNLNLGSGAGIWWQKDAFSISANYVSNNGNNSSPTAFDINGDRTCDGAGGIATNCAGGTGTVQIAYAKDNWGLAAAYNYTSENTGFNLYESTGTPLATQVGVLGNTNSVGISAWWMPENAGWIPSISTGWGLNTTTGAEDATLFGYDFDSATTQSWYVGLQWADVFLKGNSAGMAVGQQGFVTSLGLSANKQNNLSANLASDAENVLARDGQYA
jgi:hypothetical protein